MSRNKMKIIVKIETSIFWHKGYASFSKQKKVTLLKRKSTGKLTDIMDDLELDVMHMPDFDKLEDGIYELKICNESRDIESGYIDDWDYEFVKVEDAN